MRRWLALLVGTAALALAGTALALAGSTEDGSDLATETTVAEKAEYHYTPLDFDSIPDGMLVKDELPEPKEIEKEPVDEDPPDIVILHPEDGQVFETKEVVFEGKTEPGARVFAGDHEAEVSEDGAWRIVLVLEKGENHVTVKAIDEAENIGKDSVTVVYKAPKPKVEEPKEEKPKEEKPKEEPAEWKFKAQQLYGQCGENPPYDVFYGTGKPGTAIYIESEFGGGVAEVNDKGHWEKKIYFEGAPLNEAFVVHVEDQFGNHKAFEFIHTGEEEEHGGGEGEGEGGGEDH